MVKTLCLKLYIFLLMVVFIKTYSIYYDCRAIVEQTCYINSLSCLKRNFSLNKHLTPYQLLLLLVKNSFAVSKIDKPKLL